jgi:hypothetical protein
VAGVGRIAKGRGRKPGLPPGTVEAVLGVTYKERPADGSTQWSTRTLAARLGIGKDAVAKIWRRSQPQAVEGRYVQGHQRQSVREEARRYCRACPLTDRRLRRGALTRVAELSRSSEIAAPTIIAKVTRGRETLHQIKSQTATSATDADSSMGALGGLSGGVLIRFHPRSVGKPL